eukprot:TRINITY_DN3715_c0_g1_i1.p1 TRINITY_DN3715_c0_g1~~TRINITY_DN3715_c0_g1_i1.p1  ORF type:complete len:141 (-),score=40.81 TRINITY_DN3715_c0_g1_i1:131-553(-)
MGSLSGVQIDSKLIEEFGTFKMRASKGTYMVFRLSDDLKKIILHSSGATDATYTHFVENEFPSDQPRYAVCKINFNTEEGERSKMVFFSWVPKACTVKTKFVHAASVDGLKKALDVRICVHASDLSELDQELVISRCKKL